MRNFRFIGLPVFVLLISCTISAQTKDTLSARRLVESGSKGDIILGQKNKKDQLSDTPVLLHSKDSVRAKDAIRSSKKVSRKKSRKS